MKEQEIAKRFLFLSMAMNVIQLDIKNIQSGNFKIKEPYIDLLEKMHSVATNERRKIKKIMWDKRISVFTLDKNASFSNYKSIVNGKEELITYNNHVIRKNVEEILGELMKESLEGD